MNDIQLRYSDELRYAVAKLMSRQCYAALMIDGVEATERVPVKVTFRVEERGYGARLDRNLSFKVSRDGTGIVVFFDHVTGPEWSFQWSGDRSFDRLHKNQTVNVEAL